MAGTVRKHIVISAVNIRKGGTLTVLRDCLDFLSKTEEFDVTAIVHKRSLVDFENISYIEVPWSVKSWFHRLWCEYITLRKISRRLSRVDLWFSLHDTTPRVKADRQAVYCQTSFPFMRIRPRDFLMNPKIPLFAMLTRFVYRINVRKNNYLVVQQQWFRDGLSGITGFPTGRIVVAPPDFQLEVPENNLITPIPYFFYPSSPDCHKNFELLCEASKLLEEKVGKYKFKTVLTINGSENRYSRWLKNKWGKVDSIEFKGYLSKEDLKSFYGEACCLVFPSRIETWGLPVSEFKPCGKPMILADLPYAHETSTGALRVAFCEIDNAPRLAELMEEIVEENPVHFKPVPDIPKKKPYVVSWDELFSLLTKDENPSTR